MKKAKKKKVKLKTWSSRIKTKKPSLRTVYKDRIVYNDRIVDRMVLSGTDTVVITLPDESKLAIQWLPRDMVPPYNVNNEGLQNE